MMPLTIEIHGTGVHNRGAELMAIAIADRMRAKFPGVRLVVPPEFGPYEARARYEFLTTWEFPGRFRTRTFARIAPDALLSAAGVINPGEVDVVMDASGFAFADQWGPVDARRLLTKMNSRLRLKQLLILLPQAFGPFMDGALAEATRSLLKRASLICARDAQSERELQALDVDIRILRFPDFTATVPPLADSSIPLPPDFAAIVPNKRMLDKGDSPGAYLQFLARAVALLRGQHLNAVFVLHDANEDQEVTARLRNNGIELPVLRHSDPRVLKWILGQARLVVGSRFHALVSALSQSVPCIGAGWSHKYAELFADFDCRELLVTSLSDNASVLAVFDKIKSSEARQAYSERIASAAVRMKSLIERMWNEIESLVTRQCAGQFRTLEKASGASATHVS